MERLKSLFWRAPLVFYIVAQIVLSNLVFLAISIFYTHTKGINWAESMLWASLYFLPLVITFIHRSKFPQLFQCTALSVLCFWFVGALYFRPTTSGFVFAGFCMPIVALCYALLGWACESQHQHGMAKISYATALFGGALAVIYGDLFAVPPSAQWGVVSTQETLWGRVTFDLLAALIPLPAVTRILRDKPKDQASIGRRQKVQELDKKAA